MQIELIRATIKNFKGIKHFEFTPDGKNTYVFGDNATFKTTLADAWEWAIYGQNSEGRSDFSVKPQDAEGRDIHHLQTEVETELRVDGKPLMLRKMQEEKWTTPRGQAEAVLTGNTTSYWYNDKPVKATEYKELIHSLIDENVFKLVTNPLAFNTTLPWQERRNILLEMSGDATDEEVFAHDEKLAVLKEILDGKAIDDYKIIAAEKIKRLKKEREDIPPRIDELTLSLPQIEPNYAEIEGQVAALKDKIEVIERTLADANKRGEEVANLHIDLSVTKAELETLKSSIKADLYSGRLEVENKLNGIMGRLSELNRSTGRLDGENGTSKIRLHSQQAILDNSREEWKLLNAEKAKIQAEEFIAENIDKNCPTCKQPLPEGDIEKQIAEMKESFEEQKAIKLKSIAVSMDTNAQAGTRAKADVEKHEKAIAENNAEIEKLKAEIEQAEKEKTALQAELDKPMEEPDYSQNADYSKLVERIAELEKEVAKPVEDTTTELRREKAELQEQVDELNETLNSKGETERKKARIEELRTEESRIAELIAVYEGHKFLIESFIVTKANMLEEKINSKFKHVKFRLFEPNITNEGIKETCVALIDTNGALVEFPDANTAGKMNAGLEIIGSLNEFYGVSAPIFVDNAESVTNLLKIDSQVIELIKPEIRTAEDKAKYSQLVVKFDKYE